MKRHRAIRLSASHRHLSQPILDRFKRVDQVTSALVPTSDVFFLAHALDACRVLAMQVRFSAAAMARVPEDDGPLLATESGAFFAPVERSIAAGDFFITEREGQPAGFSLMQAGKPHDRSASISRVTPERSRQQGARTATTALPNHECGRGGLRPVAGCWHGNHASRRTLEKAGLSSPTRYPGIAC